MKQDKRDVWIVQHIMDVVDNKRIEDVECAFKERINETEHISEKVAKHAAMNIAASFSPSDEAEDDFDRMIHKKNQRVRVIHRFVDDVEHEEIKYEA